MKVCEEDTTKLFSVSQQKNGRQQTQVGAWKILSVKKKKKKRVFYNSDLTEPALPIENIEYLFLGNTQDMTTKGPKQCALTQKFKLDIFQVYLLSLREWNTAFARSAHENLGWWEKREISYSLNVRDHCKDG